jgi:isopentenyl diphosphate isomerase/L-lactate dehydrogenase-like FMN-dependent dehydrogenase
MDSAGSAAPAARRGPILGMMSIDDRLAYPPLSGDAIDAAAAFKLDDFEEIARERVHPVAWAYFAGGSWDQRTLQENRAAWDRWQLRPRVLVDVSAVSAATTILGRQTALPVGIAPAALHGMAHPAAELATARAATAAGVLQTVSTMSSHTLEAIAEAAPGGRRWFQLYVQPDRGRSRALVERAAAAGYEAICLTVDLPVLGYRDDILRLAFDPGEDAYGNLPRREAWRTPAEVDEMLDMRSVGLTWESLAEIRSWSGLPLVLKGILTGEDARLAVEHGADAVWVSNHGGRQLDRVAAPIDVLEEVVQAVDGRAEVYLDGGVRRGPEVVIALALGARAVFTARPFLYALAAAGEAGIDRALAIVREETLRALALVGAPRVADVTRDHVARAAGR